MPTVLLLFLDRNAGSLFLPNFAHRFAYPNGCMSCATLVGNYCAGSYFLFSQSMPEIGREVTEMRSLKQSKVSKARKLVSKFQGLASVKLCAEELFRTFLY